METDFVKDSTYATVAFIHQHVRANLVCPCGMIHDEADNFRGMLKLQNVLTFLLAPYTYKSQRERMTAQGCYKEGE